MLSPSRPAFTSRARASARVTVARVDVSPAAVAARRGASYEAEISLKGEFRQLTVRGRADGYDPALNRLDEIKTHRGDLARQADNQRHLHWAQVKIYGGLLCQARGLSELNLALVERRNAIALTALDLALS